MRVEVGVVSERLQRRARGLRTSGGVRQPRQRAQQQHAAHVLASDCQAVRRVSEREEEGQRAWFVSRRGGVLGLAWRWPALPLPSLAFSSSTTAGTAGLTCTRSHCSLPLTLSNNPLERRPLIPRSLPASDTAPAPPITLSRSRLYLCRASHPPEQVRTLPRPPRAWTDAAADLSKHPFSAQSSCQVEHEPPPYRVTEQRRTKTTRTSTVEYRLVTTRTRLDDL